MSGISSQCGVGVAKSRRVRVRPVQQPTQADPEETNIAMTMSPRTGVLEAESGVSSSSSVSQNNPFLPSSWHGGKKVVIGSGTTYEMILPGEDPFKEQRNRCTFQMSNMEGKPYKLQWLKMRHDKYQTLRMQVEILQRFGVGHLVKDQERIPIIIKNAMADHLEEPTFQKLLCDHFEKNNIQHSQELLESGKKTILEIIQSSASDLKKMAAAIFGEEGHGQDMFNLNILRSSLDAKIEAELEFQKLKNSEVTNQHNQCCKVFRKNPAPKEQPKQLPNNEEFKNFMMSPLYAPEEGPNKFNRILKFRVDQLIHSFPNGIEEKVFWKRFSSGRGDEFNLSEYKLTPSEATDSNRTLFHVCGNIDIGHRSTIVIPRRILLPACSKPKSTLDIIGETYHELKLIVCESANKSVNLRNEKIHKVVQFIEKDWGILGSGTGVRIVLEVMDALFGETSIAIKSNPREQADFLGLNPPRSIKKKEMQNVVERKPEAKVLNNEPQPQMPVLDVKPVAPSKKSKTSALPPMACFISSEYLDPVIPEAPIEAGETLKCTLKTNYGHDFFALAITDAKKIEMDSQKFFKDFRDHGHYKMAVQGKPGVGSTMYKVGTSVLAKLDRDGEYNRANILAVLEDARKYEVIFVDLGIRTKVLFSYVTSLPHALMKSPAMAVICSLRPGILLKDPNETGPILQRILNDAKELKATFHGSHHDADYQTKIWQVSLKVRLRPNGRWISVRDELQTQLGKKKNVTRTSGDDSDDSVDIFAYYANDD